MDCIEGVIPSPLDQMLVAAERQRFQAIADHIRGTFQEDDAVTAVIIGREEKMSPDDVQQTFGLTATQYKSACKKLRRFINENYPDGWASHDQQQESERVS